jgi:hypothetical protein
VPRVAFTLPTISFDIFANQGVGRFTTHGLNLLKKFFSLRVRLTAARDETPRSAGILVAANLYLILYFKQNF